MSKWDFFYAQYGPAVLNLLSQKHDRPSNIDRVLGDDFSEALDDFVNYDRPYLIKPLMAHFLDFLYPKEGRKPENTAIAGWLCQAYLDYRHNGIPLLIEDMSQLREDILYFNRLKASGVLREEHKRNLLDYTGYAELIETLEPYYNIQEAKRERSRERSISVEDRDKIARESTVLYQGTKGKVVIPHTPFASKYWGQNTKWCISGAKNNMAETWFGSYSRKTPIFMLIPRNITKVALADFSIWSDKDSKMDGLPLLYRDLLDTMLAEQANDCIRENITEALNNSVNPVSEELREQAMPDISHLTADEAAALLDFKEKVGKHAASITSLADQKIAPHFWESREFVKAITALYGTTLKCAADDFKNDFDIVLGAVKNNAHAYGYASLDMQHNENIVIAAIRQNADILLRSMPRSMQDNPRVILAALAAEPDMFDRPPLQNNHLLPKLRGELGAYQLAQAEELYREGDEKAARNILRSMSATWGNAELLFSDLPQSFVSIKAALANKDTGIYDAHSEQKPSACFHGFTPNGFA